jgi:hypothetical protein
MPLTPEKIAKAEKIYFEKPGECKVLVGPCSATIWRDDKIPLDGRHYVCAGTVILKNGKKLFANLRIQTHHFDFLERKGVWIQVGDTWYQPNEPEFFAVLGISSEDAMPFTWLPDRPLDYREKGPYPMDWYASKGIKLPKTD